MFLKRKKQKTEKQIIEEQERVNFFPSKIENNSSFIKLINEKEVEKEEKEGN